MTQTLRLALRTPRTRIVRLAILSLSPSLLYLFVTSVAHAQRGAQHNAAPGDTLLLFGSFCVVAEALIDWPEKI